MLKLTTDKQTNKQTDRQTDRQTNKQTGQKQYAPDHSIRGHKNILCSMQQVNNNEITRHIVLHVDFWMQFYCDITISQLLIKIDFLIGES